jgi:general stress protein CsbA
VIDGMFYMCVLFLNVMRNAQMAIAIAIIMIMVSIQKPVVDHIAGG